MKKYKRYFVNAFLGFTLLIVLHSLYRLIFTPFSFTWLGAAITSGSILGFFAWLFFPQIARTSKNMVGVTLLVFLGEAIALISLFGTSNSHFLALAYALLDGGCWLVYLLWYSNLEEVESTALKAGRNLPVFQLEDETGDEVGSASFVGQPALLLFYRGNWCPLCMSQVKEIAGLYSQLKQRGVYVALISPQPHQYTREVARRFDVPLNFWVDVDNHVAQKLEIVNFDGTPAGLELQGYNKDTVLPTVVLTDATGKIIYADVADNYRLRPEPQTFIDLFDRYLN